MRYYLSSHIPRDISGEVMHCFDIDGHPLLYIHKDEVSYVTHRKCPHASQDLSTGDQVGFNIICPKHHYKFDIRNGRNVSGEGYRLKVYPVLIDEHGEYIEW